MDKNTKKYYKKRFFTIFFSLLLPFFIFYITCIVIVLNSSSITYTYSEDLQVDSELVEKTEEQLELESNSFLTSPVRTNFLITGVDNNNKLTDTIMVASFVSTTGEINLISIPRDTYVTLRGSGVKINSVNAYGGDKGMDLLKGKIEELLNIRISYYFKVNLDAFKSIVDTIGGVYFEVPAGGLKYTDPTQGLYINLKEGYQLLNGSDAEGLVRFRKGYASQDLQRVKVQQEFLKALISQVLDKQTLLKNIGGLAVDFIKYVDTNFGLLDIPKYLNSITKIDKNNFKTDTLPGAPQSINGISYYITNKEETSKLVDEFFYGKTSSKVEDTESITEENLEN